MAQSYTRQSTFVDGDTITASLFNDEYSQLVNAFTYSSSSATTTGHRHDGTAGHGGNVHTIGDLDFLNKIVADSTNNRWGFFVEVSSSAVEQIRIQDGAIVPVTDNDIDLGTSSLEFKDLFIDGTAHVDTLDVDANGTVAGTFGVTGATTLSSTLAVTGAVTGSSTIQGTTITATTAFVPDASDGAALGTSSLEFSDLFLADGAVINFGDDQDVTLTHVADTGLLLNSTMALQFNDASQYINAPSATVLDINATDEIELNATLVDINANVEVSGTLTVAGAVDFGDAALSNVGAVQLDSIAGDGDTNTSITFSGSDVITIANAGTNQVTFNDGSIAPVSDSDVDLGTSSLYFKDAYIDSITTTGNVGVGGNLTVTGTTTFNGGTITMGDAASDNVVFGADVNSNIIPNTDNAYDLGSSSQEWKDLYVDGIAYLDGINFNGTAISATAAELNIMDGVTSTAAELNILDGVTSTTAELNILDGATVVVGEINALDLGSTAVGTAIASKAVILDANKDYTGVRNFTITGELDAATLDISGDADIDGTLEADAITIGGVTLAETIADTVGAMVSSNTETNITVSYEDADNTLDFVIGTLNQDTTGTADNFTVSANNSTDETVYPVFVDGATGSQGAETDTGLTYNPSTGLLTSTGFSGNLTGTLQTAAQTNITSVGTLTALTGGTGDFNWD